MINNINHQTEKIIPLLNHEGINDLTEQEINQLVDYRKAYLDMYQQSSILSEETLLKLQRNPYADIVKKIKEDLMIIQKELIRQTQELARNEKFLVQQVAFFSQQQPTKTIDEIRQFVAKTEKSFNCRPNYSYQEGIHGMFGLPDITIQQMAVSDGSDRIAMYELIDTIRDQKEYMIRHPEKI